MSDDWIALIPADPHHVPDAARTERARERFAEIAPDAEEIEIKVRILSNQSVVVRHRQAGFLVNQKPQSYL
jgi:hypothetical protein